MFPKWEDIKKLDSQYLLESFTGAGFEPGTFLPLGNSANHLTSAAASGFASVSLKASYGESLQVYKPDKFIESSLE